MQQEFITSNFGIFPQRPHEKITFYSIFYLFFILKIFYLLDEDNNWGLNMSELKKKLDGARPHCLPRALVLINPGNPTGTLNVYRFVIRAVILMQMMMMMMMTIMMMMVMVIKFLYLLSTLFYHTVRLVRSSFLFTGCLL